MNNVMSARENYAWSSVFRKERERPMKKIFLILMTVLLAAAFCSCGELTAYQLYTAAAEKAEENKDNFETDVKLTVTVNGFGEDATTVAYGIHEKVDGDNISAVISTDSLLGIPVSSNVVYIDGYVYMDVLGTKLKSPMTLEKFTDTYSCDEDYIPAFDATDLKDVKVEKSEDGLRAVRLTVSADKINSAISEKANELIVGAAALSGKTAESDLDITISDVTVAISFDNSGYFKTIKTGFSISAALAGKTVLADVVSEIEYLDFGATSVELPDEAENYKNIKDLASSYFGLFE